MGIVDVLGEVVFGVGKCGVLFVLFGKFEIDSFVAVGLGVIMGLVEGLDVDEFEFVGLVIV